MTAAEIAKLANVTRAAVSNWRRRYEDFPEPTSGAGRNALYALTEVDVWLSRHGKGDDLAPEVLAWQALRGQYGEDIVSGLADVDALFKTGTTDALEPALRSLILGLARQSSSSEVISALTERFLRSPGRAGSEQLSTHRLVRAIGHFAGPVTGTVFDPACGIGSLLLAFKDRPDVTLVGQEVNPAVARFAASRVGFEIKVGDSLRDDQWAGRRASLVLCDPPVSDTDWGRENLLLDARWEFGVPTRAEGELAWLQHCYAHVEPGGRAIVVMPASVAYRKAGRRIRAELVRRGVLGQVIGLPAGIVAAHSQPVHLWVLVRPAGPGLVDSPVRMVDLTDNNPEGPFEPTPNQLADVPRVDLLDDEVDLTPARYVVAACTDQLAEYLTTYGALMERLQELRNLLPCFRQGPGSFDGASVRMADLVRAGLVELADGSAVSTSEQLDTDYLAGFMRSAANIKRATSGSGTHRADVRGSRVPQMGIDDQREYGAAFRTLDEFERCLMDLAQLGERAVAVARDGLTRGVLLPQDKRSQ